MTLSPSFLSAVRCVHALIPYTFTNGEKVSPCYDSEDYRRQLGRWFAALGLPWSWQPVTCADVRQVLDELTRQGDAEALLFLNLCDGSESDGYPGLAVTRELARRGLAFTGADPRFYEVTTCKVRSKELFLAHGVPTAPFRVIADPEVDLRLAAREIGYPLFMKLSVAAGSTGVSLRSVCHNYSAGLRQHERLRNMPTATGEIGRVFVEPFIAGREFTGLLVAEPGATPHVYPVAERVFSAALPSDEQFLSFDRYWEYYQEESPLPDGEKLYSYASVPVELNERLAAACRDALLALAGCGYARVDLRMNSAGEIFVLEVNSNCGISDDGLTSVSQILHLAGVDLTTFLAEILQEGWQRRRRPG